MKKTFSKLFELKLEKRQIIIISIVIVALIVISLAVYFVLRGKNLPTFINNNAQKTFQEGFADDSEEALTTLVQPYDTEDTEPTYDLYAEVGTPNEDSTYDTVQTSSNFSPDSEECDTFEEGSCIDLGREKKVMPNHSTVNLTVWESYATEWSDEGLPGARVGLKAYAVLPDGSMAAINSDTKVQFNFYDKETRIVQMEGEVYYRVKPQEEGHVFTVQAGDRLIELNDTEAYIQVEIDNDEMIAKNEEREKFEYDSDYVNDPYITQEEYNRRSEEMEQKMEEYNRESEEYRKNIYAVRVYVTSGSAKIYSREDRNTMLYELTEDNPFTIFKYRDYEKMNAYEAQQEEIDEKKDKLATGYESTEFMANLTFSMSNYGMGSKYSNVSIFNPYSNYGSPYSSLSPFNQYTNTPPIIYLYGQQFGHLSKNKYLSGMVVDPDDLRSFLKSKNLNY